MYMFSVPAPLVHTQSACATCDFGCFRIILIYRYNSVALFKDFHNDCFSLPCYSVQYCVKQPREMSLREGDE